MRQILFLLLFPICVKAQYNKAQIFVNSLDGTRNAKAVYLFEDMSRYNWHYLPASMIPRNGLPVKELDSIQKIYLYDMFKEFLSDRGYSRTKEIMSYEYLLKDLEPENPIRIPENYSIAIYGDPLTDKIWGWKFSGHHVALNFTIVDNKHAFTPFFFGAYPAVVKEGKSQGNRIIKEEEDLGLALINSFSDQQRQKALFQVQSFIDIVTTNSIQTGPLTEVGIVAKDLAASQKLQLNKLIVSFLSSMPTKVAKARMEKIAKEDFDKIRFGWAGGFKPDIPHYYRIQGASFLIEFDNTQHNANHIHTVWRDFHGDFGFDLLREHYRNSKHDK